MAFNANEKRTKMINNDLAALEKTAVMIRTIGEHGGLHISYKVKHIFI
jgi:hypothetical protein